MSKYDFWGIEFLFCLFAVPVLFLMFVFAPIASVVSGVQVFFNGITDSSMDTMMFCCGWMSFALLAVAICNFDLCDNFKTYKQTIVGRCILCAVALLDVGAMYSMVTNFGGVILVGFSGVFLCLSFISGLAFLIYGCSRR